MLSAVAVLFQCLRVAAFVGIRIGIAVAVAGHVRPEAVEPPGPLAIAIRTPLLAITAGPANVVAVLPEPGLAAPEASRPSDVVAAVEMVHLSGEEVGAVESPGGAAEASPSQANPSPEAKEGESSAAHPQPASPQEETPTTTTATATTATATTATAPTASVPSTSASPKYVTLTGR